MLSDADLKKIKYVNLHAHSHYSLQDGVGSPKQHFIRTMQAGHCGCALTDHGSYASGIELFLLQNNSSGDAMIDKEFKERNINQFPTMKGAELYIYDDRYRNWLLEACKPDFEDQEKAIERLILKMDQSPRFSSLFNKTTKVTDIEVVSVKKENAKKKKEGTLALELLKKNRSAFFNTEGRLTPKGLEIVTNLAHASVKFAGNKYSHITIIAKNNTGHKNLSTLTTKATLPENFYTKPRIPLSLLIELKEGLIVTSGCFIGMIPQAIFKGDMDEANQYIEIFKKSFGEDFYLEMHLSSISHDWDRKSQQFVNLGKNLQEQVNGPLYELAKKHGLTHKIYITQDSHYPEKKDKVSQDLMILSDPKNKGGWHFYDAYPVLTVSEMYEKFRTNYGHLFSDEDFVQWCETSIEVIEKTREFNISTDLKMLSVNYDAHPMKNSIVLNPEAVTNFLSENDINLDRIERYVLETQIRFALFMGSSEFLDKTMEIPYKKIEGILLLKDELINRESSKKNSDAIIAAESELDHWAKEYTNEHKLQRALTLSKDPRFPELAECLRVALRVCVNKGKVDFKKKEYRDRLFFELDTIQFNGMCSFVDYFMVFEELVRFITAPTIAEVKGPGRGSAAGSILSYALDITDVDPIKRNLPFFRFLLKERIGVLYPFIDGHLPEDMDFYNKTVLAQNGLEQDEYFEKIWNHILDKKIIISEEARKELVFIRVNSDLAGYFWHLIESGVKVDSNGNNSHLGHALGLCPEAKGSVKSSARGVPDIDYDSSCRDDLVRYLVLSKGPDKVALIGSYGSLKIKSAAKVVFRVKSQLTSVQQNKITALFDRVKFSEAEASKGELYMFEKACSKVDELREFWDANPDLRDYTKSILGVYSSSGIHACGVLILTNPVYHTFPCRYDKGKNMFVTENDKDFIEELGGIKMDLLGLGTLEIMRDAFKLIKRNHDIDFLETGMLEKLVDLNDQLTMENLAKGDTLSVFQANTPVQTATYNDLRVKSEDLSVEDCSAINAIDRPGPMLEGFHHQFVRRKNGEEKVDYLHPSLEPYLKDTMGLLVYQEQVMQICQDIGGFTPFEADKIRKAMGKKKFKIIEKFEKVFKEGVHKNNIMPEDKAIELWGQMSKFAEYSFNRAHAFSYGCLTYLCSYFKSHYLEEWVCANFSRASRKGNDEDFKNFYRRWGDLIMPPNVNSSGEDYDIVDGKIYMPLFSIKGVGEETSRRIAGLRPFNDFKDFILKLRLANLEEKTMIERLILTGACDHFANYDIDSEEDLKELITSQEDYLDLPGDFLQEIKTKLELGIELEEDEVELIKEKAQRDLDQDSKIAFRKELLNSYFFKLRNMKIKNKISEWIKKNPKSITSEDLYEIYRYNDLRGTPLNKTDLNIDGKAFDPIKYCKGSPLKLDLTPKEEEKASEIMAAYSKMNTGHFILKELEFLGFTSYDFRDLFKEQLESYQAKTRRSVTTPEDLVNARSVVLSNFNKSMDSMGDCLKAKLSFSEKVKASRDFIIPLVKINEELINNYKIGQEIKSRMKSYLNKIEEDDKIQWMAALDMVSPGFKSIPSLKGFLHIRKNNKGLLCQEAEKIINYATKIKGCPGDLLSQNGAYLSRNEVLNIQLVGIVLLGGKKSLLKLKEFNVQGYDKALQIFKKLGIDKSNYKLYQEALKQFPGVYRSAMNILRSENDSKQRERLKVVDRSVARLDALKSRIYVFGTLFRPEEKKHFIRGYGKGFPQKRMCRFFIANEDYSVTSIIFDIDSAYIYTKDGKVPVTDKIIDFTPVIVAGRLSFDPTRNFEITFMPSNETSTAFDFVF